MITDKQKNILLKNGYTQEEIAGMSYEAVSSAIGAIFTKPKEQFGGTTRIPQPNVEQFQKASQYAHQNMNKSASQTSSFYISYAKDICVAMINAAAVRGAEPVPANVYMDGAIECVKRAVKEFA